MPSSNVPWARGDLTPELLDALISIATYRGDQDVARGAIDVDWRHIALHLETIARQALGSPFDTVSEGDSE